MLKKGKSAILSSGKVNRYGYRLMVEGARLQSFKDNPVMLYVHRRASSYEPYEDIATPIGRWDNIRIENGQLLADPVFDMEDEFAAKIARKWEQGFLHATSVRHTFDKVSEEPDLILEGQTRVTVTEWEVLEASIVDIPGDKEAVKLDYVKDGEDPLSKLPFLSLKLKSVDMDLKTIARSLGLSENATEGEVTAKIAAMTAQRVEGILTLGRRKGIVTDDNAAVFKGQIEKDPDFAELSWKNLSDKVVEMTPSPVGTLAAALRQVGQQTPPVSDGRETWTMNDWRNNDTEGLLALETQNPTKYQSLITSLIKVGGSVAHLDNEKRKS